MSIESQTRIKINAQIDQYIRNIDVVVRALASYQCDRDSDPAINAISGLSLSLVLSLELRGFSPGTLVFPSPQKPTFPNSRREPLSGCTTSKSLFIYYFSHRAKCWVRGGVGGQFQLKLTSLSSQVNHEASCRVVQNAKKCSKNKSKGP